MYIITNGNIQKKIKKRIEKYKSVFFIKFKRQSKLYACTVQNLKYKDIS